MGSRALFAFGADSRAANSKLLGFEATIVVFLFRRKVDLPWIEQEHDPFEFDLIPDSRDMRNNDVEDGKISRPIRREAYCMHLLYFIFDIDHYGGRINLLIN